MVNALRAGTIVAVVSATMGWFMVLRRQTFAGHTLSLVGFPGAAGAILLGISPAFGYFGFCVAAALVIGSADPRAGTATYRQESALIGTVQAMALASGFLFVSLYHGNLNGLTGLLFGSFLGITSGQVLALLAVAGGALIALGLIARPLLFASVAAGGRGGDALVTKLAIAGSIPSILSYPFMRNAFVAGGGIAASCGLVGYFVVLRGQVFTGDALSHVAFTGALAALAAGFDLRIGLFGATVSVAVGMGVLGRAGQADDVVIGSVFAWTLGLGVLFLSIYTAGSSGSNGTAGVSVLFGSILGLSAGEAQTAAAIGAAVCAGIVLVARPLLFASVDEGIAAAAGV